MKILTTQGQAEDVPAIMPVMTSAFDPRFGEAWNMGQCIGIMSLPGSRLFLARDEKGFVVGFALSRCVLDEAELMLLAVLPDSRRTGVGMSLIQKVIDDVTETEISRLFLEVREGNPAIEFYNRVGFLQIGRRNRYYRSANGEAYDALTLEYRL
jgi:ribosomal-protein-alanine N-acetyltransferase